MKKHLLFFLFLLPIFAMAQEAEPLLTDFFEGEMPVPTNMDTLKKKMGFPKMASKLGSSAPISEKVVED
jgi:hypothetical protein